MEAVFADLAVWLDGLGVWAWLLAPLVMALVAIFPIPAEAPAMVNGILFGPVAGTAVTWCGAMVGAVVSFEISRRIGRPLARRFLRAEALARADAAVRDTGWPALLAARFVPVIAFTALNWAAGLTPVPRWRFVWTTAVGILPGAILFTASGSGLARLLQSLSPVAGILAVVALAVLLAWGWRRRRRRQGRPAREDDAAGAQDPRA